MVSVVIPVYNNENYIGRCLESLLCQDYQDYEIIIINDGSTDDTVERVKAFNSDIIKLFTIKNSGPSAARNYGINKCNEKSDYLLFVDSDDTVEKDFIKKLVAQADEDSLAICSVNHKYEGSEYANSPGSKTGEVGVINDIWHSDVFYMLLKNGVVAPLWNKCYSLKIIRENNMSIPEQLPEDIRFNLEYLRYVKGIRIINEPLYNYIHRANSVSSRPHECLFINYINIQKALLNLTDSQYHKEVLEFVYPQYLALTFAFIRTGESKIPGRYLAEKEVRKAIINHRPSCIGDCIVKYLFLFRLFFLLKKI